MKYRLKPIEVDAVQWWPPGDERHDPVATPVNNDRTTRPWKYGSIHTSICLNRAWLLETDAGPCEYLTPGDWIVTKPDGSICRITQKEFVAGYEEMP